MTLTFDLDLTLTVRLTFDLDDFKKTNCFKICLYDFGFKSYGSKDDFHGYWCV